MVLRFFDPQKGQITLGGIDLKDMSFSQIRENIAVVNQDTFLFHGSVGDNIRMGRPEASDEEIQSAAKAANIDGFIGTLPEQYDTIVGEKGIKLSGGQRQRVAIARAILRDSPILILDEALSAVDAENEAIIQDALNKLMVGRTTIILAHRLSSIIDCDRIIVIDDGHVVETGVHSELILRNNIYSALMRDQAMQADLSLEMIQDPFKCDIPKIDKLDNIAGGSKVLDTEGVIKAEGLNWYEVIKSLMGVIMPWKGRVPWQGEHFKS
jgi:ATP-binding cassette subfamily C protein CydCD